MSCYGRGYDRSLRVCCHNARGLEQYIPSLDPCAWEWNFLFCLVHCDNNQTDLNLLNHMQFCGCINWYISQLQWWFGCIRLKRMTEKSHLIVLCGFNAKSSMIAHKLKNANRRNNHKTMWNFLNIHNFNKILHGWQNGSNHLVNKYSSLAKCTSDIL